ncbi:unnamed protein product, partial [Rotaria magnacalcarata]
VQHGMMMNQPGGNGLPPLQQQPLPPPTGYRGSRDQGGFQGPPPFNHHHNNNYPNGPNNNYNQGAPPPQIPRPLITGDDSN